MSSDIKLLPCPFCGGEGSAFIDKYKKYFTGCCKCNFYYGIEIEDGCELENGWVAIHNSKEEAIKAWNTRKPMDRIVFQLEEKKKRYEDEKQQSKGLDRAIFYYYEKIIDNAINIVKDDGKYENR